MGMSAGVSISGALGGGEVYPVPGEMAEKPPVGVQACTGKAGNAAQLRYPGSGENEPVPGAGKIVKRS